MYCIKCKRKMTGTFVENMTCPLCNPDGFVSLGGNEFKAKTAKLDIFIKLHDITLSQELSMQEDVEGRKHDTG